MKKTPKQLSEELKNTSKIFNKKKDQLKDFAKEAPRVIRIMEANADMLQHAANELEKFSKFNNEEIDFPDYKDSEYYGISRLSQLHIPSRVELASLSASMANIVNDATGSVIQKVTTYPGYSSNYIKTFPSSFSLLKQTDELVNLLNQIDPKNALIWQAAREQLAMERDDSIKNAANSARTIVDEISRLPDYEHLKTLPWFEPDKEGKPIRPVRYGWIFYGDILPSNLNNKSEDDPNYKALNSGYKHLHKYVHNVIVGFNQADKVIVESSLNTIETSLINYLNQGMQRLIQRIRDRKK